jgi:hypothetical protein
MQLTTRTSSIKFLKFQQFIAITRDLQEPFLIPSWPQTIPIPNGDKLSGSDVPFGVVGN